MLLPSLRARFVKAAFRWLAPLLSASTLTIGLGLSLDLTGALHVYGLSSLMGQKLATGTSLLLVGLALGWVAVAAQATTALVPVTEARRRRVQRGLTLLLLLAWLATVRSWLFFLTPQATTLELALAGVGTLGLILALGWPPAPIWLVGMAAVLGSCARLLSFAVVPIDPAHGDMLPLVQGALGNLMAGQSPYALYAMPWEVPLTYLPLTWLAYLPPYLLGADLRITNVCAELGLGLLLLWQARLKPEATTGLLLWAWLFLQPSALSWSLATTAPVQWLLLTALLLFLSTEQIRPAAVLLGLCLAATPLVSVIVPFALLCWWRLGGWRLVRRQIGTAALVALPLVLPFLLWAPQPFSFGVWRWFNDNDLYPRLRWELDQTWARMIGFSGMFWRHHLVGLLKPIQALLLLGVAAHYQRGGATALRLAPYVATAFLLFTLFNPVLWPYLYNPALLAALVAVTRLGQQRAVEGVLHAPDLAPRAPDLDEPEPRAGRLRIDA